MNSSDIAPRARSIANFFGRPTLLWGTGIVLSSMCIFLFDLAFAFSLQRFLMAVGLIAPSPAVVDTLLSPNAEAAIFLFAGVMRLAAAWANSTATGLCHVAFEQRQRRHIVRWALHSGQAPLGEAATLFNDVVVGSAAAVANVFFLAGRFILIVGSILALSYQSIWLTMLMLGLVLLLIPIHSAIDKRLSAASKVIQTSLADAVSRLVAGVKNSTFLHIHGMVGGYSQQTNELVDSYASASWRYYGATASRSSIPQLVGLVVIIALGTQGSSFFADNSLLVAYVYMSMRLFQSLGETSRVSANLRLNWPRLTVLRSWWLHSLEPVRRTIDIGLDRANAAPFEVPVGLRFESVTFRWEAEVPLIQSMSFEILPASKTVIIGPSGMGKTTLMLLLTGLVSPVHGHVKILADGQQSPVMGARGKLLASAAFVGPDPFIVPGTIRDFLTFGSQCDFDLDEIKVALELADCDFVATLPRQLQHPLTEQGSGLSAGQKQRLALARALLRKPKLLLLDEATANLDPVSESRIVSTLEKLCSTTIVAISHRDAMHRMADQVITLHREANGSIGHSVGYLRSGEENAVTWAAATSSSRR